MNNNNGSIKVNQGLNVITPQDQKCFIVWLNDWEFIKDKIVNFKESIEIFINIGWGCTGISVSALFAALSYKEKHYPTPEEFYLRSSITWGIFGVFILIGILSFIYGVLRHKDNVGKSRDLVKYLNNMESKSKESLGDGN